MFVIVEKKWMTMMDHQGSRQIEFLLMGYPIWVSPSEPRGTALQMSVWFLGCSLPLQIDVFEIKLSTEISLTSMWTSTLSYTRVKASFVPRPSLHPVFSMSILKVIKTGNTWEQVQVKGSAIGGMQHNLDPLAKSEESAVPTKCIFRIKKVGSNWSTHGNLLLVTPQLWWRLGAYRWQKL